MKSSYYRHWEKSTLFWKTSLCWKVDTILVFFPHSICSISKPNIQTHLPPLCITDPHRFARIKALICLPGRGVVGIGSKSDHAPPLPVLSGHLLRQIVLTEPLFYLRFLPAPMAINEISLVQITTPFSSLGSFLYDTFQGAIVGIVFSGKSHTFLCPPENKSGSLSAQSHPNRQQSHKPYAQSHRRQKKYPSGC